MINFGTGGWRAVIGDEFIKSNIQQVVRNNSVLIKVNSIFFNPQFYMHNFALSVFS